MKIEKYTEFNNQNLSEEIDWENLKYKLGKLGSITKGGKFFGRKKQDSKAKEEIDALLKDANNKFISDMDKKLKEVAPEFPNNKSREQFLEALSIISATYDSIIQASHKTYAIHSYSGSREDLKDEENKGFLKTDKDGNYITAINPGEEGYMTIEMANALIESLQKYMKRLIDYDLSTSYTVFEKNDITEEEAVLLESEVEDLINKLNEEISLNPLNWFKKKKESPALTAGSDTATKKMVHSTKYEKIFAGLGVTLGVFGWVVQTDWFRTMMESWLNKPEITKDVITKDIKNLGMEVKDGEGLTQALNRTLGTDFNKNTSVTEFVNTLKGKGFGNNPTEIFNNLGIESLSPNANFNVDAVSALSRGGDLQNAFSGIFHGKFGTLLALNPGQFIAKQITSQVTKVVVQQAVKVGTTIATGLAAAGPFITGLGIAMVAGAITSWLLKRKSKKSSRYKDLQELLEKFKLIQLQEGYRKSPIKFDDGEEFTPIGNDTIKSDEEGVGSVSEKSIYSLMIKNLTQLKSLIITSTGVKLEGEGGNKSVSSIQVGKEYYFTNKKGDKKKVKVISLTHDTAVGKDRTWLTRDDIKQKTLSKGNASVIFKDKKGGYSASSPEMAVSLDQLSSVKESVTISKFADILLEDKKIGTQRNVEVTKGEDYLTQAVDKIRKSLKSIVDEKDKGIGITEDFIQEILDKKMDSNTKTPIKELYAEVYDYLYGKKSSTLGEFAPLYKESVEVISNKGKRQVVAEKIARFTKRSLQFEGEGFYGGMGEFGADLQDFNNSFKQIMNYFKEKGEVKENKIYKFKDM